VWQSGYYGSWLCCICGAAEGYASLSGNVMSSGIPTLRCAVLCPVVPMQIAHNVLSQQAVPCCAVLCAAESPSSASAPSMLATMVSTLCQPLSSTAGHTCTKCGTVLAMTAPCGNASGPVTMVTVRVLCHCQLLPVCVFISSGVAVAVLLLHAST
jgi:hypothetical protein